MADPTPKAVEALAKVLSGYRVEIMEGRPADLRDLIAQRILANPGPLLEALAEAGVLEVERRREKWHEPTQSVRPHARLVSPWKPVSGS